MATETARAKIDIHNTLLYLPNFIASLIANLFIHLGLVKEYICSIHEIYTHKKQFSIERLGPGTKHKSKLEALGQSNSVN